MRRAAFFGGIYNNAPALREAIQDARRRGAEALYCLGDLGGFGPHPERIPPILRDNDVVVIQGNYEDSVGHDRDDCQCGYTDPRDKHFAQLAYEYTRERTPAASDSAALDVEFVPVAYDHEEFARERERGRF